MGNPKVVATGNGVWLRADVSKLHSALLKLGSSLESLLIQLPNQQTVEGLRAEITRLAQYARSAVFVSKVAQEDRELEALLEADGEA